MSSRPLFIGALAGASITLLAFAGTQRTDVAGHVALDKENLTGVTDFLNTEGAVTVDYVMADRSYLYTQDILPITPDVLPEKFSSLRQAFETIGQTELGLARKQTLIAVVRHDAKGAESLAAIKCTSGGCELLKPTQATASFQLKIK